jgi:hypothetical protein
MAFRAGKWARRKTISVKEMVPAVRYYIQPRRAGRYASNDSRPAEVINRKLIVTAHVPPSGSSVCHIHRKT